ncbi:hypothetical protein PROH_18455 [Prochlorothrix hollandica PCC 9006 = CALU 1027]|uniref:Uncharacterized protein n=1 Tax=Prochlorothrix hollandica PCC 9006 = CALU 1027 TaxID=317619 RepID=A0A0M2PQD4_PROHO|nr:hypothetical protein PROH_18455 [Prochlorothrix hollandica PCC 9006 = CALU 1027]
MDFQEGKFLFQIHYINHCCQIQYVKIGVRLKKYILNLLWLQVNLSLTLKDLELLRRKNHIKPLKNNAFLIPMLVFI